MLFRSGPSRGGSGEQRPRECSSQGSVPGCREPASVHGDDKLTSACVQTGLWEARFAVTTPTAANVPVILERCQVLIDLRGRALSDNPPYQVVREPGDWLAAGIP